MTITVQTNDRLARITVSNHFDFKVHYDFKDAYMPLIDNTGISEIEVDMNKVEFIDSSALGMLLLLKERCKTVNKNISWVTGSSIAHQVLEVAHFDKVFNIRQAG